MPLALLSLGCGDEVGDCEDPNLGRDTVLVDETTVQYGGQAILNASCATCHGSGAKGEARRGAPAGLDFDLFPVDPDDPNVTDGVGTNEDADSIVKLKRPVVAGLRERQRKVFEQRNLIWQQVKDELMPPPGGAFASLRNLMRIVGTAEESPCTMDKGAFEPITQKSSRDVLRNWLACGAPIVEINSSQVTKVRVAGAAGYQYPLCGDVGDGGVGDGGAGDVITLETVQTRVFGSTCAIGGCHDGTSDPDLRSADRSFAALVQDTDPVCAQTDKPFVTPGNSDESYIYEVVSEDNPTCGKGRMPLGSTLSRAQMNLISDWIKGGAKREGDVEKRVVSPIEGIDAGLP